jgi:N-acyl-D-amino-acid deacylase
MTTRSAAGTLTALILLVPGMLRAAAPPDPVGLALARGLHRLEEGATRYTTRRSCFSCHHQALTIAALRSAGQRGLGRHEPTLTEQVAFTLDTFRPRQAQLSRGQGSAGGNTMVAYALFALESAGHRSDATTTALVDFLLVRQRSDGAWPALTQRQPSEGSPFTNTALALRALEVYGQGDTPAERRERIRQASDRGKRWLLEAQPTSTEDRVFHLRGLVTAQAGDSRIAAARETLLKDQQSDGSWAQLPGRPGDAYATGSVLLALRHSGMAVSDPVYQRGVAYLLRTQTPEGAWIVTTRSRPVQVFFDNGDPGGKNQFISFAATGWAVLALLELVP